MDRQQAAAMLEQLRPHLEMEKARWDFRTFLKFVRILEPPPGLGVIPFEVWPHLDEVVTDLGAHRLVVWLKPRQIGATWTLAAYAVWTAQYQEGARVLLGSRGEAEARTFLWRCQQVWRLLPDHLRLPLASQSTEALRWQPQESSIRSMPSIAAAGRSETASLVIMDEADFHPELASNLAALRPTIDDTGGQLILVSTANYRVMDSTFRRLYAGAPDNGYQPIFFGWNVRPGRDDAWLEEMRRSYPDPAEFAKEYPATALEALAPPETLAAFPLDVLKDMEADVRPPTGTKGVWRIWQRFQAGKRYVAGTDTAHGVGQDYSVTAIMDAATGYIVADILSSSISPTELAYQSVVLLETYDYPLWGIEDNEWGALVIKKAEEMGYPNLYSRDETVKRHPERPPMVTRKVGWHTGPHTTVHILWGDLIDLVAARGLVVPAADGLAQFASVIRNPAKGGKIEALGGGHDDYPVAVGIAVQMRKELPALAVRRPVSHLPSRRERTTGIRRF